MADELERLQAFCEREDATAVIARVAPDESKVEQGEKTPWSVELKWGREAEDSPMAGAAAYGIGPNVTGAIDEALKDAGA